MNASDSINVHSATDVHAKRQQFTQRRLRILQEHHRHVPWMLLCIGVLFVGIAVTGSRTSAL